MYFKTWLKYQSALIYHVTSKDFMATPMPTSVWRDVLSYEDMQDKKDSPSGQPKDMKSSRLFPWVQLTIPACSQFGNSESWPCRCELGGKGTILTCTKEAYDDMARGSTLDHQSGEVSMAREGHL